MDPFNIACGIVLVGVILYQRYEIGVLSNLILRQRQLIHGYEQLAKDGEQREQRRAAELTANAALMKEAIETGTITIQFDMTQQSMN